MHSSTEDNLPKPQKETGKQDDSPFDNSPDSSGQPGTGRTAYMGLLLALALILSYVETLIPFQFGVPGIKLGLANLAVVLSLYLFDWKRAFFLTTIKAFLSGLLFGNLFMIAYSLAGAWLSVLFMILLKKSRWFHARKKRRRSRGDLYIITNASGVYHHIFFCNIVNFPFNKTNHLRNFLSYMVQNIFYIRQGQ